MDKRSFDQNVVITIASGGFVVTLYQLLQVLFTSLSSDSSPSDYFSEVRVIVFAGLTVMLFALIYGIFTLRKRQASIEQIWEQNRRSVVKYCLSMVDNDVTAMKLIFEKLESQEFDFYKDSDKLTLGDLRTIDYAKVKDDFSKFPLFQNTLGFITHEQYTSIYDYLKTSSMFVDLLDKNNYQKGLLKLRSEQAKKLLELFKEEEENHHGLSEWKKYFS